MCVCFFKNAIDLGLTDTENRGLSLEIRRLKDTSARPPREHTDLWQAQHHTTQVTEARLPLVT